jgi:hypothetical protein
LIAVEGMMFQAAYNGKLDVVFTTTCLSNESKRRIEKHFAGKGIVVKRYDKMFDGSGSFMIVSWEHLYNSTFSDKQ